MNKKALVLTLVAVMLISTAVFAASANIKIKIIQTVGGILNGSVWSAEASGSVEGVESHEFRKTGNPTRKFKGAWLGITAIVNGKEIDYPAIEANGRFKEKRSVSPSQVAEAGGGEVTWVAKLWQAKIFRSACEQTNKGACSYCKKNGYHLMGQLDSAHSE